MKMIVDLAEGHRQLLDQMLADVPPGEMCRQPNGLRNHAAWQVGHLAFVRSAVAKLLGGEDPGLGEEWGAKFGRGTEPTDDPAHDPAKEDLVAKFAAAHEAALRAVGRADDAALERPNPIPGLAKRFPTMRALVVGMFGTHDGLHLGQLSVWRRAMGLPRVL